MRKSGSWIGKSLIKRYMNRRMAEALSKDEFDHMLDYMHQIFMREGSTEYAIYICFQLGLYAHHPLEDAERLGNPELPIPVSFFYGDRDWMDYRAGERVVVKNRFHAGQSPEQSLSQVYIVTDSDHHLYLDNPS